MHDASESYISDLTRPIKAQLSEYFAIEETLQKLIYEKFGQGDLTEEEKHQINDIFIMSLTVSLHYYLY